MKTLSIFMILAVAGPPESTACTYQIYDDPKLEPDYTCPGPGEEDLVPRLKLRESAALRLNDPAPWEGILMGENRVLSLGFRIKALRRLRWQETIAWQERMRAEKKLGAVSYKAAINLLTRQRDRYRNMVGDQTREIVRLRKWYRSPVLWYAAGIATAAAGALTLALLSR